MCVCVCDSVCEGVLLTETNAASAASLKATTTICFLSLNFSNIPLRI